MPNAEYLTDHILTNIGIPTKFGVDHKFYILIFWLSIAVKGTYLNLSYVALILHECFDYDYDSSVLIERC